MQKEIEELFQWIQKKLPSSVPKLELFPSGAAMLWAKTETETYVLEYLPKQGYGVSRVSTAGIGFEGAENAFDTFEEARKFLLQLLME